MAVDPDPVLLLRRRLGRKRLLLTDQKPGRMGKAPLFLSAACGLTLITPGRGGCRAFFRLTENLASAGGIFRRQSTAC